MTSSTKKRKEKRKDFQKTQLKVGKTKPKPSSYTDTSFKAKSIVVKSQSISVNAPTDQSQFEHHVSMLRSHSDLQRADSLAFLTTAVAQLPPDSLLPQPAATLLLKTQPLILDTSLKVRTQLLKLLKLLPAPEIRSQADSSLLYLHAAMSSLYAGIRAFSMEFLNWLIDVASDEIVSSTAGWVKTLYCFQSLLGWQYSAESQNGWSAHKSPGQGLDVDTKTRKAQMTVLIKFLKAGLGYDGGNVSDEATFFPLHDSNQHSGPSKSNTFNYLKLFGMPHIDQSQRAEDIDDRQRIFATRYASAFTQGLQSTVKEGGEIGRTAATLRKVIQVGIREHSLEGL